MEPEKSPKTAIKGRGAPNNPVGRFEKLATVAAEHVEFPDPDEPLEKKIPTTVYRDTSRSVISTNDSPDIGMEATVNPYRGCEHGCIYCYARPTHEYFGLSAGQDFESKIFAKTDAPALLRKQLAAKSWQPRTITFSGVTDCYQPIERRMKITRGCLEVLAEFRNPVAIITKNNLVTRDIDVLAQLAAVKAAGVFISVTTLDAKLARTMEPRAARPALRLAAVEALAKAGIPVAVMVGPVLPGLTDHEIPAILESAANAGAQAAYYTMLRLPYGVKDLFQDWLQEHYPDRAAKILNRVRSMRGGKLNNSDFATRMRGEGVYADQIAALFTLHKKRFGLTRHIEFSTASFRQAGDGRQGILL